MRIDVPDIAVNEEWSFQIDHYGWMCHRWHWTDPDTRLSKKHGTGSQRICVTTYHATLRQVVNFILDQSVEKCEDLESLIKYLDRAEEILLEKLENKYADQKQV